MTGTKSGDDCKQTLFQNALESLITNSFAIPSCALSIWLLPYMGAKHQNIIGFAAEAILFALLAVVYLVDRSQTVLLFALFCALNFCLSFGPNVGTYVIPAICFPEDIRSTCHGISAAGGKLGAFTGAIMFPLINDSTLGLPGVLSIQAALCIVGALISYAFQKHDWEYLDTESRIAVESFVYGEPDAGSRDVALLPS